MFLDTRLSDDFNGRWVRLERKLSELDETALDHPATTDLVIAREADADVPQLERDKAAFEPTTQGTATVVRVRIPFTGDYRYFATMLDEGGVPPEVNATWSQPGTLSTDQSTVLILQESFPAGVAPSDVKAWAKKQVDQIETYLNRLRSAVEKRAAELRADAQEFADARLLSLQTERNLKNGLGRGI